MSATDSSKMARRWLQRLVGLVLLGLGLFFFGSNLLMDSGWGRSKIAGKLRGLSGFEWSVDRASWSPWGGIRVGGMEMRVPEVGEAELAPVLTIDEVRVQPYWRSLLGGSLKLREAVVQTPEGDLPLELLAALAPAQGSAQVLASGEGAVGPEQGSNSSGVPEKDESAGGGESVEHAPSPPGGGEEESARKKGVPAVDLPGRVLVRGGRLRVFSHAAPQWSVELLGCEADLPIAGPEALGWVSMSGWRFGVGDVFEGLRSGVEWNRPVLTFPDTGLAWGGVALHVRAELLVGKRPRIAVSVGVPPSELAPVALPGFPEVRVGAGQIEAGGSFQGELMRPASWRGNLVAAAEGLSADGMGRLLVGFEQGRVALNLRNGVLHLVDGRLVGEQFSVMGNGGMRWDGQVLGVVRLVGDWEYEELMRRIAAGARLSKQGAWMTAMETPDRRYRDIHIEGPLGKAHVDVGLTADGMTLTQAWSRLRRFMLGEKLEEDQGVPPSPDWGPMMLKQ